MNSSKNILIGASYILFTAMIIYGIICKRGIPSALSVFGIGSTKYVFTSCLIALSLMVLYFQETFDFKGITKKWLVISIRYGSIISSLSLILVGLIDMDNYYHNIFAAIYFILAPILAISFGIIYKIKGNSTISTYLLIIGLSNLVISSILFKFTSLFLAEITHSSFVFVYIFLLNRKL